MIYRVYAVNSPSPNFRPREQIKLKIFFGGEFRDPDDSLIDEYSCGICIYPLQSNEFLSMSEEFVAANTTWMKKKKFKTKDHLYLLLEFNAPDVEGEYFIYVHVKQDSEKLVCDSILPYISDKIVVSNASSCEIRPSLMKSVMLSNYRQVTSRSTVPILLREEYGAQIGSHIYDSSIILIKYLEDYIGASWPALSFPKALELGCGCGLIGIWLAKTGFSENVLLSDLEQVLPFSGVNACLNNCSGCCFEIPCDWRVPEQIDNLKAAAFDVDLIVAADVLYDAQIAVQFFSMLNELMLAANSICKFPVCFVAQKDRSSEGIAIAFDPRAVQPPLQAQLVHTSAKVWIWRIDVIS